MDKRENPKLEKAQTDWFHEAFESLVDSVSETILGKRHVVQLAFTAMISGGHLLLEDVPGTGKTSLARALAGAVQGTVSRIQFTPDLLPSDVTGVTVYDQQKNEFEFIQGPIFANIVLADEINRASPKTQSALLEVMEEKQITADGTTYQVAEPFLVIATQNPVEQAGTYRLPEAQLDRFMLKTSIGYPDHANMIKILSSGVGTRKAKPMISVEGVASLTKLANRVYADPLILDYIARIVEGTRNAPQISLGTSVRGALALTRAAKTWAVSNGRSYVTPDDVKTLAEVVLAHRLIVDAEAEFDGVTAGAIVRRVLLETTPPRSESNPS